MDPRIKELEEQVATLQRELLAAKAIAAQPALSTGIPLDAIVQSVIGIGVELVGAKFGAFFYSATDADGQHLMLYALSGAPREAFARFPVPGRTALFSPTFDGEPTIRSDDIVKDPRYGHSPPHYGMPAGHLPVRSYLSTPVVSAAGEVLGGLFFGHPEPAIFTARTESIVGGIAQIAAIALENSRLLLAVQHSERHFKAMIENSSEGISVVDADAKITYVSAAVSAIEGYSPEELLGRNALETIHPDDRQSLSSLFHDLASSPGKKVSSLHRRRHKDGHWLWIEAVTTNLLHDPAVRGIVSNFRDVTERKRAEEALIRSQKMEALGTLAGGIAHDFNNLLLAIAGNAKLALADLDASHPAAQSLKEIGKAGRRATDLVGRILSFSRQQEPRREVVELQPVIEDALHLLRATLPAMIEIQSSYAADVPQVYVDPSQIHQVVMNMVTNAAHAIGSKAGRVEVSVDAVNVGPDSTTVRELAAGRYARLTIRDNGSGMDTETLARIFDPFFTTKPAGQGTGLGLSVVHGIVRTHEGTIAVYSQPGKGSAFHIYLPAGYAAAKPAQSSTSASSTSAGERVLYIDDDSAIVFLTGRILERLGYRVTACEGSEEGLKTFQSAPDQFDVVVTDLSMPGMSGFDIARALKAIRPELPILMTSGYVRPEDREAAQAIGIRDVIYKPNSVEELGEALDRLFRQIRDEDRKT